MNKIKDNWFIIIVLAIVFLLFFGKNLLGNNYLAAPLSKGAMYYEGEISDSYSNTRIGTLQQGNDFAPEVKDRKIIKNSNINIETKRGKFRDAEDEILGIIRSTGSILLSQDVNRHGKDKDAYYTGYYQIKVISTSYDNVMTQLKNIGEVLYFKESQDDVTGNYVDLNIEIQTEKSRLSRYQYLYDETTDIEQKIRLTDTIFNQERKIKYMEDSLYNMNQQVKYSTIYISLNEKRSDYANIVIVKLAELIRGFVNSLNSLLRLIFIIVPWVVVAYLLYLMYNFLIKGKKKR